MNSTLEKWLFFLGVILFLWFLTPELDARAADFTLTDLPIFINGETKYLTVESIDGTATATLTGFESLSLSVPSRFQYFYVFTDLDSESVYVYFTSVPYSVIYTGYKSKEYGFDCLDLSCIRYFEFYVSGTFSGQAYANSGTSNSGFNLCTDESQIASDLRSKIFYSNTDIYYGDILVFQRPLPSPTPTPSLQQKLLTAVEKTNPGAVMMNQVVGLVPLLIGFAITLIGFSKALQTLFQVLRMA